MANAGRLDVLRLLELLVILLAQAVASHHQNLGERQAGLGRLLDVGAEEGDYVDGGQRREVGRAGVVGDQELGQGVGDEELAEMFAQAEGEEGYRRADQAWVQVQLLWLKARATWAYASPLDFARAYCQAHRED